KVSWAKSIVSVSTRELSDSDRRRPSSTASAAPSSSAATTLQPKSLAKRMAAPPLPHPRSSTFEPLPKRAISARRRRDWRPAPRRAAPEKCRRPCSPPDMNARRYIERPGSPPVLPRARFSAQASQVVEHPLVAMKLEVDRPALLLGNQIHRHRNRKVLPQAAGALGDGVQGYLGPDHPLEQLPHILAKPVLLLSHHLEGVNGRVVDQRLIHRCGIHRTPRCQFYRRLAANSASALRSPLVIVMWPAIFSSLKRLTTCTSPLFVEST